MIAHQITYHLLAQEDTQAVKDIVKDFRNQDITDKHALHVLSDDHILIYTAFDQDIVCGYVLCYLLPRMDLGRDMLHIYHCFVKEEYKRRHIASTLIQMALDYAKEQRLHYVYLITQTNNIPANALYTSLGGYNHPQNKEIYYWYITDRPKS